MIHFFAYFPGSMSCRYSSGLFWGRNMMHWKTHDTTTTITIKLITTVQSEREWVGGWERGRLSTVHGIIWWRWKGERNKSKSVKGQKRKRHVYAYVCMCVRTCMRACGWDKIRCTSQFSGSGGRTAQSSGLISMELHNQSTRKLLKLHLPGGAGLTEERLGSTVVLFGSWCCAACLFFPARPESTTAELAEL